MELHHRFEVPVGVDRAWESLLDMEQVAACFPGATLASADGKEYTGSVKVKLGPIQLTYQGSARIVETDEQAHRAVIEAAGKAARSGSTASMKVNATATAVTEDRTEVSMTTDLTITGRPAQFGRGVMAEVGDKILGQFATCLASKLSAGEASPSTTSVAESSEPQTPTTDDNAAAESAPGGAAATESAAKEADSDGATSSGGTTDGSSPSAEQPATSYTRTPTAPEMVEPIDLLESARGSIIKRALPIVAGLILILLWRGLRRRRPDAEK